MQEGMLSHCQLRVGAGRKALHRLLFADYNGEFPMFAASDVHVGSFKLVLGNISMVCFKVVFVLLGNTANQLSQQCAVA
jgi:hypothetical protein